MRMTTLQNSKFNPAYRNVTRPPNVTNVTNVIMVANSDSSSAQDTLCLYVDNIPSRDTARQLHDAPNVIHVIVTSHTSQNVTTLLQNCANDVKQQHY